MPLYRRTEPGYVKKFVLFSMSKQSLQENQQNSLICMGMRDKTSTLGKFCSLASKICRLKILRSNRRGKMLVILLHCCSLFFAKTITSISPKTSLTSERAYRTLPEKPSLFPGIREWKYFASCHMLEEEHCIN